MKRTTLFLLAILWSASAIAVAEDPPAVEDLAWLAGRWTGDGLGGTCEEIWSPPMAGAMVGTFRHFKNGEPVFYELLLLTVQEGQVVMKVKHFTPGFEAWEEKADSITFRLKELTPTRADFGGLVMNRVGDDRLQINLTFVESDGSRRVEQFDFSRSDPPPGPRR